MAEAGEGFRCEVDLDPPVIHVFGDVDMTTAHELSASVGRLRVTADPTSITFDLGGVTFMDSSGLSVLVDATAGGRRVVVRHASGAIRRLIEITGLETVVHVEP